MQVYAIYASAHRTPGKVQATAAAEADKDHEPAGQCSQNLRPTNTADPIDLQEREHFS